MRGRLELDPIVVSVNDGKSRVVPEVGAGGYAPHAGQVHISLAPGRADWRAALRRALAHELHHCSRWRSVGPGSTLVENAVFEGLADHFTVEVYGPPAGPWTSCLDERQLAAARARAEAVGWTQIIENFAMFGRAPREGGHRWSGYALGFRMVGDYLSRHPGARPSLLVNTTALKILRGAGW